MKSSVYIRVVTIIIRAPLARCMALAIAEKRERAGGETTITLRAGDEANVILVQQCCSKFNGSQQQ